MEDNPLNAALRIFETAEANLVKLENIWEEMEEVIPKGVEFLEDSGYESNCRDFENVLDSLPKIDGWKPDIFVMDLHFLGGGWGRGDGDGKGRGAHKRGRSHVVGCRSHSMLPVLGCHLRLLSP